MEESEERGSGVVGWWWEVVGVVLGKGKRKGKSMKRQREKVKDEIRSDSVYTNISLRTLKQGVFQSGC